MKKYTVIPLLSALLSACDSRPEKLDPPNTTNLVNLINGCLEISKELDLLNKRTLQLYGKLKDEHNANNKEKGTFRPFLTLLKEENNPHAVEYSILKSEHEALQSLSTNISCGAVSQKSPEEIIKDAETEEP